LHEPRHHGARLLLNTRCALRLSLFVQRKGAALAAGSWSAAMPRRAKTSLVTEAADTALAHPA
jgi:hypothetical protein